MRRRVIGGIKGFLTGSSPFTSPSSVPIETNRSFHSHPIPITCADRRIRSSDTVLRERGHGCSAVVIRR